jgi:hypothetical protein
MAVKSEGSYGQAFYASLGRRQGEDGIAARAPSTDSLLEVGIEDFDVQERGLRDGHSFRPNTQQLTQSRYKNS